MLRNTRDVDSTKLYREGKRTVIPNFCTECVIAAWLHHGRYSVLSRVIHYALIKDITHYLRINSTESKLRGCLYKEKWIIYGSLSVASICEIPLINIAKTLIKLCAK